MSVDIRLVEYLLRASGATLNSFAMAIPEREQNTKELKNYFGESFTCATPLQQFPDAFFRTIGRVDQDWPAPNAILHHTRTPLRLGAF